MSRPAFTPELNCAVLQFQSFLGTPVPKKNGLRIIETYGDVKSSKSNNITNNDEEKIISAAKINLDPSKFDPNFIPFSRLIERCVDE